MLTFMMLSSTVLGAYQVLEYVCYMAEEHKHREYKWLI